MIELTDFLELSEIRAALGVSEYELSDETLALPMYARGLERILRSTEGTVGAQTGSLLALYDALSGSTDEDELYFVDQIKQLAVYAVAESCLTGISLFAAKSTSDGKATETRFSSEATFKDVASNIRAQLATIMNDINIAVGNAAATGAGTLIMRASPSIDVVTDESA